MNEPRTHEVGKYRATSLNVCLDEVNARKLGNLIFELTGREVILATHKNEKTGHGHTHIACPITSIVAASEEELMNYFIGGGHDIYRVKCENYTEVKR